MISNISVSGSDLMTVEQIQVRFVAWESKFTRRPISHTCGCVLEVPHSYSSFVELREEFDLVLTSGVWVMDIV